MSIVITKQPISYRAYDGEKISFSVEAEGIGLIYQWQYSTSGEEWHDSPIESAKSKRLNLDADMSGNGLFYRCIIRDDNNDELISEIATLTVEHIIITEQPKNIYVAIGDEAIFSVTANGIGLTYNWQYSNDNGTEWTNLSEVDFLGANSTTVIFDVTEARMANLYRCRIAKGETTVVYSDAVTVSVPQYEFTTPEIILPDNWYGRKITISTWVKSDNWNEVIGGVNCAAYLGTEEEPRRRAQNKNIIGPEGTIGYGENVNEDKPINGKWARVWTTFELTEEMFTGVFVDGASMKDNTRLCFTFYLNEGGIVDFKKIKAEWGNTATEWSQAPEDIVDATKFSSEIKLLKDQIALAVTKEDIGEMVKQSVIEILPSQITLAVSQIKYGGRNYLRNSNMPYEGISKPLAVYNFGEDAPKEDDNVAIRIWGDLFHTGSAEGYELYNTTDNVYIGKTKKLDDGTHGFIGKWTLKSNNGGANTIESNSLRIHAYPKLEGNERKNLLPPFKLWNGMYSTDSIDLQWVAYGRIRITGAAKNSEVNIHITDTTNGLTLPAGTYTISKYDMALVNVNEEDPLYKVNNSIYIVVKNIAGSKTYVNSSAESATFTLSTQTAISVAIRIPRGSANIDNIIFPQIERGDTHTAYEQYIYPSSISKIMFEIGTMYTDWTPAPEDAESELGRLSQEVKEAKLLVTPEEIISTVTSTSQWQEQSSKIDQNAEKISLSVTREQLDSMQVGGRNYLKNSDDAVSNTAYCVAKYSFGSEMPKAGDICTVRIWGDTGSGASTMFSVSAVASNGTNYTFGDAEKRDDGTYVYTGAWPVDNAVAVNVYRKPYSEVLVKVDRIKLETGEKATDWTPHWEEFKAGSSIVMTEDKVNITTQEFNVNIAGSDGETNMLSIDEEGAQMTSLSAPNVAMRFDGPDELYVNPAMTPSDKYYRSLSDVFDMLSGKSIDREIKIYLNAGSTEYCSARLKGTTGGSKINIAAYYNGGSGNAKIVGSLMFDHIGTPVMLQNIDIDAGANSYGVRAIGNSTHVTLGMCVLRSTSSTGNSGFMAENGAAGYVGVCEFYNMNYSMIAKNGGVISAMNCSGNCSVRAERGMMFLTGTMPSAASAWNSAAYSELGGKVFYESVDANHKVTVDKGVSGGSAVTVPSTATVTANNVGAYYGSWRSDGTMRQGMYNGSEYAGCMWFLNAAFSGRTIKNATLKLKRLSGSGRSRTISLYLYTITLSSNSGNPHSGATNYGLLGEIGQGETKSFTLPLAAAQALANGTAKGFMLYANDQSHLDGRNYSANYCKIGSSVAEAPELTVNYI